MITVGIDMGAKNVKALVLRNGCGPNGVDGQSNSYSVAGRAIRVAGIDADETAREVLTVALSEAGVTRGDVHRVCATGVGRNDAPDRDQTITDVSAAARAAALLHPEARTIIDVGAEEGRVIRTEAGKVVDFAINEKCAAGAGAFAEAMARALEVTLEELGPLSLESTEAIPMNAQCVVFAESEVVSMIHENVPKPDMARSVHDAIASRIVSMTRRVGGSPPVVLVGGMARNVGFVDSLQRGLEIEEVLIPDSPEFISALGAALAAAQLVRGP
jgi:benzoyl-CoA reductase subunit D